MGKLSSTLLVNDELKKRRAILSGGWRGTARRCRRQHSAQMLGADGEQVLDEALRLGRLRKGFRVIRSSICSRLTDAPLPTSSYVVCVCEKIKQQQRTSTSTSTSTSTRVI